jgi:small subunit ribosomal protein S5
MNKKPEEQPDNNNQRQEQAVPEGDSDVSGAYDQIPKIAEIQPEELVTEVRPSPKRVSQSKKGKASDTETAAEASSGDGFVEKVVAINRITKVTKGGKKLSFSALVVVGDMSGNVGYSLSKAAEVSVAIRKAVAIAKRNMVHIPMHGTTIPHEIIGQCSGSRVLLKPASDGTGVIAAGPVRAVCDGAGIRNILTKCHRSNNPINVVKATFDGLTRLKLMKV